MKKKVDIKTIIRKIVREEVAMAIHEVVDELKQPVKQVEQNSKPNKINEQVVTKKQFSNNSVLNNVLNETAIHSPPISPDTSVAGDNMTQSNTTTNQGISLENEILNKDYSSILQKSIEKSKQKQGM